MSRVPPVMPACPCESCAALSDALDRHRAALEDGRDTEPTRRAVSTAAIAVDRLHALDRPIRRRSDVTPPCPPDPEPEEDDGWFESAGQRRTAAVDAVARRVGFDR